MDYVSEKKLALLIDAENISYKYISTIFDELKADWNITIKRIYGDFSKEQLSPWNDIVSQYALTQIQQLQTTSGKNSSDMALVINAMDILYRNNVDAFCIVSSDSDFSRLISRLKQEGKFTIGMGESKIENDLLDLIDKQINPTIATYAKDGECTVRITAKGKNEKEVESLIEPISNEIKSRFKEKVYGEDDTAIEDEVAKILVDNNLTIAVAESCTGGMVAADLINYPGISSVFMEGCVTYSNEAKMMTLNVKKETLNTVGAVSEQCAKEMSEGVAARHNTNIGLSTTGIAGPEGGSEDKPVGLVYMGITINNKTIVKKYIFNGNRQQIRSRACKTLLNDLRLELLKII